MIKRILPIFLVMFLLPFKVFGVDYVMVENFDDGNHDGWIEYKTDNQTLCSNAWKVEGGVLKADVDELACSTNLYPSDELWKNIGSQYELSFDMWMISGIDHNIAIRFEPLTGKYYEYHFQSPSKIGLNGGPPAAEPLSENPREVSYAIPNRSTPYKIVIKYINSRVELFIDGNLAHKRDIDVDSVYNFLPSGRMALRAGAGTSTSETHFDNIRVTSLDVPEPTPGINLPYFSQTDPEWKDEKYDSVNNTIGNLGCSLASVAMALHGYGITTLPDSTPLTPLSLNSWLVDNKGYNQNGDMKYPKLSLLSKEVTQANPSDYDFEALELKRLWGDYIDYSLVDQILNEQKYPIIFKESRSISPSGYHFDVAKGVIESSSKYSVNDPLDETRTQFEMPPDSLASAIYFEPSNTNLSYITVQADDSLSMRVNTPLGEVGETVNTIDGAYFGRELPVVNYLNNEHKSGNAVWEFWLQYPEDGLYEIKLDADETGWYPVMVSAFDTSGEEYLYQKLVFVSEDHPTYLKLKYHSDDFEDSKVKVSLTISDLKEHLKYMIKNGAFKNKGIIKSLENMLNNAERFEEKRPLVTSNLITVFVDKINKLFPKLVVWI